MTVRLTGLETIPEVRAGDDLARIIWEATKREGQRLSAGCVVVVAQKVVSLAEGAVVDLREVRPSPQAESYAREHGKDPRLVEVILQQTKRVVRMERGEHETESEQSPGHTRTSCLAPLASTNPASLSARYRPS